MEENDILKFSRLFYELLLLSTVEKIKTLSVTDEDSFNLIPQA